MIFENSKVYDILKFLASPVLPAVATLCIAIGEIWNVPVCSLIGATVAAVAACLGEITRQSSKKFLEGKEIVTIDTKEKD